MTTALILNLVLGAVACAAIVGLAVWSIATPGRDHLPASALRGADPQPLARAGAGATSAKPPCRGFRSSGTPPVDPHSADKSASCCALSPESGYPHNVVHLEKRLCESFPGVAESVPSARKAVTELAGLAGATADQLDSIRLAVSEALTNAVVHGYADRAGNIHVSAAPASGELWVLIADDGPGLRPRLDRPGLGLGFALIVNCADRVEIANRASGGTELRMRFRLGADQSRGSESSTSCPTWSSCFSTTT